MIQDTHIFHSRELEAKIELLRNHERTETDSAFHADFWRCLTTEIHSLHLLLSEKTTKEGKEIQKEEKRSLFFPIHPLQLSMRWNIDLNVVLTELLYATKVGLLEMHWAIECLQCSANTLFGNNLEQTPANVQCTSCGTNNAITSLDQIIVLFHFSPDILQEKTQEMKPTRRKSPSVVSASTLINHSAFHLFRNQVVPHDAQAFDCSFVVLANRDVGHFLLLLAMA